MTARIEGASVRPPWRAALTQAELRSLLELEVCVRQARVKDRCRRQCIRQRHAAQILDTVDLIFQIDQNEFALPWTVLHSNEPFRFGETECGNPSIHLHLLRQRPVLSPSLHESIAHLAAKKRYYRRAG